MNATTGFTIIPPFPPPIESSNPLHVKSPCSALDMQAGGDHYRSQKIQPIEFIHANGLDFFQGNIVKYAARYKLKGGAADLRKVIHYAQLALELQYGEKP